MTDPHDCPGRRPGDSVGPAACGRWEPHPTHPLGTRPHRVLDLPSATYRPCRVCAAPAMEPFPDEWTIELIKEGPEGGPVDSYVTPHRSLCDAPAADPRPGLAVRVSGRYVTRLTFAPPPVSAAVGQPTEPFDMDGFTEVGYTDGVGGLFLRSRDEMRWRPE